MSGKQREVEIRDVIHGAINVERDELPVIDSRYFQRLRQIKQLGFAENSFPGATHNRYIHSLGAMETATQAFDSIFKTGIPRLRKIVRLAALLHDVGHGPLSHTTEFAMPKVRELRVPGLKGDQDRKATHEDYTLKIILDSGLADFIRRAGAPHGFGPAHVASLIDPALDPGDDFFVERLEGERIDFRPVLRQLISSELDADRMDYLRRDSLHTGVSYGQFDFPWIVGNLTSHVAKGRCYLALEHRALYAFEDFLLSRFHMFLMVYFHYKSVVFDEMLAQYLTNPDCPYRLPSDIEEYCGHDDARLHGHLSQSRNEWARRIADKRPYRILMELHSGIPAGRAAAAAQDKLLEATRANLERRKIHSLSVTSTGELSKYFRRPGDPIYVRYDNHYSAPEFIPLEECTDLFRKYAEKRSITRLYVSPEDYPQCRDEGRHSRLDYEAGAPDEN